MNNFDNWNQIKKEIGKRDILIPKESEIWIINLGYNIGFEMYGKNKNYVRLALILKSFGENGCWIIPLTSKFKKHFFIHSVSKNSFANILQFKFIDNRRCLRKISNCNKKEFNEIKCKFIKLLS